MTTFKVGDWVQFIDSDSTKYVGKCLGIRDSYHSDYGYITVVDVDWTDTGYFIKDIELWKPQEGEFVIPKNFSISLNESFEVIKWKERYTFKCEPFIGTLPEFIQGK